MEGPVAAGMKAALKVLNEMGPGKPDPVCPLSPPLREILGELKLKRKQGLCGRKREKNWGSGGG